MNNANEVQSPWAQHMQKQSTDRCPFCNYDLSGLSDAVECPECGNVRKDANKLDDFRFLSRFVRTAYAISFCISMLAFAMSLVYLFKSDRVGAYVPPFFYGINAAWAAFGIYCIWIYQGTAKHKQDARFDLLGAIALIQLCLLGCSCIFVASKM